VPFGIVFIGKEGRNMVQKVGRTFSLQLIEYRWADENC